MALLAHSARYGYPEQSYKEHVSEVLRMAKIFALGVLPYIAFADLADLFMSSVCTSAEYHDLGKIDTANQKVLSDKPQEKLPVKHEDAGTALLLQSHLPAALSVFSHHSGLPSIGEEREKEHSFRNVNQVIGYEKMVMDITNENLKDYIAIHATEIKNSASKLSERGRPKDTLFYRIALSCLVDADHTDTARHYGGEDLASDIPLSPVKRLAYLDAHINSLAAEDVTPERLAVRQEFYHICRNTELKNRGLNACSMPVGTGKTTSVMAHLLRVADQFGLRRVFVVLPFTNIINQSVNTYRNALISLYEDPEAVVAAHHYKAEYKNQLLMASSFRWNAPITVTTAVQFFETLASSRPSSLRKLHNLPGAAIFIDEAHATLPAHLWPQAWKWLLSLVENWGCHVVLGSGSLSHFWHLEEFSEKKIMVPEIAGDNLFKKAAQLEQNRIVYRLKREAMNLDELCQWVCHDLPGPRIVVMNTVQSAAALADKIACERGRDMVEHLSTALTSIDREKTLKRIKLRLKDKGDIDWTLVATTCAEAGLNFSFRSGAREMSSLGSTIQLGGRVNRQCEYGSDCELWCFYIKKDAFLREHKHFRTSAAVLAKFFDEGKIGPDFCTEALLREIREKNTGKASDDLIVQAENRANYPSVSRLFQVIEDDGMFTVIVDEGFKLRLENREKPTSREMQTLTVRMRRDQIEALRLPRIGRYQDLYFCYPEFYDDFLGYMEGILKMTAVLNSGSII